MTISNIVAEKVRGNNRIIGLLMIAFDRGQKTIELWLDDKDIRLTTPTAVEIIKAETGLTESEIFEKEPA